VHACQRIFKFEVFIIFVYFLDIFSTGEGVSMGEKMGVYPLVQVGNTNRDKMIDFSPGWSHQPGLEPGLKLVDPYFRLN
jgi:hypothetical protein